MIMMLDTITADCTQCDGQHQGQLAQTLSMTLGLHGNPPLSGNLKVQTHWQGFTFTWQVICLSHEGLKPSPDLELLLRRSICLSFQSQHRYYWDSATLLTTQLKLEATCDHRQDGIQGGTPNNSRKTDCKKKRQGWMRRMRDGGTDRKRDRKRER